ncbi:hypothetical protein L7F22_053407 [Adiantum nelumboides]|nr:hypothetical protein [Adiantum nelumboides]
MMPMARGGSEDDLSSRSSCTRAALDRRKDIPLAAHSFFTLKVPIDACRLLQTCRTFLEQKLKEHGALFLRGFPLHSASDFQSVVDGFGWQTLRYIGSSPRTRVGESVYTANDADPDKLIDFHHEMSTVPDSASWPPKVLFFCETPPPEGGQTAIIMSHKVTQTLREQRPDFMQKLEDFGLLYLKVLPLETNFLYISLQGWPTVFGISN